MEIKNVRVISKRMMMMEGNQEKMEYLADHLLVFLVVDLLEEDFRIE